jgi:flagellar P-ring protein precursor FlgI
MADAKALQGGVLLQTPLVAGDGQVYAVAQGSVFLGGFDAGSSGAGGSSVQKNHLTSGVVTDGAIVEQEIPTTIFSKGVLEVVLRQGDFTTAVRMANAINEQIGHIADAVSPTTVQVFVPPDMRAPEKQMEFVARIENAQFVPDVPARIVINERTGTIVANANIQIAKVAVAFGNLTVAITNTQSVSQPNSFTGNGNTIDSGNTNSGTNTNNGTIGRIGGGGEGAHTQVVDNSTTNVQEEKRALVVFNDMPTVEDVAFALNSMGATPRELMSILQSIKDAGALNAELVLE